MARYRLNHHRGASLHSSEMRTQKRSRRHPQMELGMIIKRRRFKQTQSLEERLAQDTAQLLEQAKALPSGPDRRHIMRRIRQNETATHMSELLRSPPSQPTK